MAKEKEDVKKNATEEAVEQKEEKLQAEVDAAPIVEGRRDGNGALIV